MRALASPPDAAVWTLMRGFILEQDESYKALTAANAALKEEAVRLAALIPEDEDAQRDALRKGARSTRRREFDAGTAATEVLPGLVDDPANPLPADGPLRVVRTASPLASVRRADAAAGGINRIQGLAGYRARVARGSPPTGAAKPEGVVGETAVDSEASPGHTAAE